MQEEGRRVYQEQYEKTRDSHRSAQKAEEEYKKEVMTLTRQNEELLSKLESAQNQKSTLDKHLN